MRRNRVKEDTTALNAGGNALPIRRLLTRRRVKMSKANIFYPCGEDTGLGCGIECWGGVPRVKRIKKPGKRAHNVVFCSKCAKEVTDGS